MRIIRVFPRRTSQTPADPYAFVGDPPLWLPVADEVHVSVSFTWDTSEGRHLQQAWGQHYGIVRLGGPAYGDSKGDFEAGLYVRHGITFTSRGCNNACPWCLVPEREGPLREMQNITPGHIVQDNNLLQCSRQHRFKVFQMLRQQHGIELSGGLEADLITNEIAEEIRSLRIKQVFLAADTEDALKPLEKAVGRLKFLSRRQLRCFLLIAYGGEGLEQARERLERVWEIGCLPFAQLYQPPDTWVNYSAEWRVLAREWSRPAAIFARHRHC